MSTPTAAARPDGTTLLFAYGTLMDPEIFRAVTQADYVRIVVGAVTDYVSRIVKGEDYPAAIQCDGKILRGVLLAVPNDALAVLDAYEGDEYGRQEVQVTENIGSPGTHKTGPSCPMVLRTPKVLCAQAYIWKADRSLLRVGRWAMPTDRRKIAALVAQATAERERFLAGVR